MVFLVSLWVCWPRSSYFHPHYIIFSLSSSSSSPSTNASSTCDIFGEIFLFLPHLDDLHATMSKQHQRLHINPVLRFILTYIPLCATAMVRMSGIGPMYTMATLKETGNVNPMPFIAMIISSSLGMYYSWLINNFIIFIGSCSGIVCGSIYFCIFCMYSAPKSRRRYLKIFGISSVVCLLYAALPFILSITDHTNYIGFGVCTLAVLTMSSPLASMRKVLKEKNTKSMSLSISIAMTINGMTWTIYGIIIMDCNLFIVIPNALGAVAGFVQLSLFCIYPSAKDLRVSAGNEANYRLLDDERM